MRHPAVRFLLLAALALAPALTPSAKEPESVPISAFFGAYEGRTLFPMGEQANRGLKVEIRRHRTAGFSIWWETSISKEPTEIERKATTLVFDPSRRPGIFEAMYPGDREPRLIDGDSYAWAQLFGKTLTVHVVTIVDGGDYVIQSYERTLTEAGLKLEFTRLRNGVVERQLKGNLNRVVPAERSGAPQ